MQYNQNVNFFGLKFLPHGKQRAQLYTSNNFLSIVLNHSLFQERKQLHANKCKINFKRLTLWCHRTRYSFSHIWSCFIVTSPKNENEEFCA